MFGKGKVAVTSLKCPACEKGGLKSEVRAVRGHDGVALLYWHVENYYDEDGKLHIHDSEIRKSSYKCSNGHKFNVESKSGCCDKWFGFNKVTIVEGKE